MLPGTVASKGVLTGVGAQFPDKSRGEEQFVHSQMRSFTSSVPTKHLFQTVLGDSKPKGINEKQAVP